jgi:TP901-1 family phage major tail protein
MAKTPIAGKDIKLFIEKDGDYIVFGCLDDTTLNMESDTITAACKDDDDNGWETSIQGMKRWSMDLSGIFRLISGADVDINYSVEDLFNLFVSGEPVNVRFGLDGTGNKQFAGAAKLFNMSVGAPMDGEATFSGTLTGQGPLTLYTVPA